MFILFIYRAERKVYPTLLFLGHFSLQKCRNLKKIYLCAVCQRDFNTLGTFVRESVSESRIPLCGPCHCQKIYEVVLVTLWVMQTCRIKRRGLSLNSQYTTCCHCSPCLTMHCVVPQNKSNIRMRTQCHNLLIKKICKCCENYCKV